jgi:signal peptidase I
MPPLPQSQGVTQADAAKRSSPGPQADVGSQSQMAAQPNFQSQAGPAPRKSRGSLRGLIDAVICLYVAVILFRTFEIEGYIISTGSMAPHLLGFHKRVVCPNCGYEFAHGIPVDETGTAADTTDDSSREHPGEVRCPNCGEDRIDLRSVPPNHGDQLLVQKNVYEFRQPRRWEVVVLKSPSRPTPFVKRIVGLPNESVQIRDGDIYVDGEICRKNLELQRAARILVNDNDHPPDDPGDGKSCWLIENPTNGWSAQGNGFAFAPAGASPAATGAAEDKHSWIAFRRWVRHGGRFHTTVSIANSKPVVHLERSAFPQIRYDQAKRGLEATGAIDRAVHDRLLAMNSDSDTRTAIEQLCAESHVTPITDDYGYNRANAGLIPLPVRDLLLECQVALGSGSGTVKFEIGDGRLTFHLVLDREKNETRLELVGHHEPLRTAPLTAERLSKPFLLEFSTFDRQVIAAIDGALLFPPWEGPTDQAEPPRVPVRIGARGIDVEVSRLRVYRDIYYTRGQGRNASDQPIQLGADEFFVLGDNSPVSNDGRSWGHAAIKQSQLVGKPFVVHLPSRPGRISLGGFTRYIRVPDFSRIRYIR